MHKYKTQMLSSADQTDKLVIIIVEFNCSSNHIVREHCILNTSSLTEYIEVFKFYLGGETMRRTTSWCPHWHITLEAWIDGVEEAGLARTHCSCQEYASLWYIQTLHWGICCHILLHHMADLCKNIKPINFDS